MTPLTRTLPPPPRAVEADRLLPRRTLIALIFAALVATTALAVAQAAGETAPGSPLAVEDLAWIAGSWSGEKDGVVSEEHWTTPAGGGLVGMHKDVRQGRMIFFEFLRIVSGENGVCYVASPGGAPPTSFCAVEAGERRVVFENPRHDFPRRILYWIDGDGRLHARVEGPPGGSHPAEEWIWSRSAR
jgi:hypothetical protein